MPRESRITGKKKQFYMATNKKKLLGTRRIGAAIFFFKMNIDIQVFFFSANLKVQIMTFVKHKKSQFVQTDDYVKYSWKALCFLQLNSTA